MKRLQFLFMCGLIVILVAINVGMALYVYSVTKRMSLMRTKLAQDYFAKKQECEKYAVIIKEDKENSKNQFALLLSNEIFELVFYSPKENSCLYATERLSLGEREYFIYNVLTHSKITSFKFPEQWQNYKDFLFEYSGGEIRL